MPENPDRSFEEHPFARHLGFRTVALGTGLAEVAVTPQPEHANFLGSLDGALVTCLIDHASAYAASGLGKNVVGAQFSQNMLRPAPFEGELVARARVVHDGRKTVVTEAAVTDARGKIVARASYLHMVVD